MPLIVTGLTAMTDAELIQFAKNVHTALKGNANVPAPNPTLPALQTLITTAETGVQRLRGRKGRAAQQEERAG